MEKPEARAGKGSARACGLWVSFEGAWDGRQSRAAPVNKGGVFLGGERLGREVEPEHAAIQVFHIDQ